MICFTNSDTSNNIPLPRQTTRSHQDDGMASTTRKQHDTRVIANRNKRTKGNSSHYKHDNTAFLFLVAEVSEDGLIAITCIKWVTSKVGSCECSSARCPLGDFPLLVASILTLDPFSSVRTDQVKPASRERDYPNPMTASTNKHWLERSPRLIILVQHAAEIADIFPDSFQADPALIT